MLGEEINFKLYYPSKGSKIYRHKLSNKLVFHSLYSTIMNVD